MQLTEEEEEEEEEELRKEERRRKDRVDIGRGEYPMVDFSIIMCSSEKSV